MRDFVRPSAFDLALCMFTLAFISIINLRGVRETGAVFLIPTWLFVGCLFAVLGLGIWKMVISGGHPTPLAPLPKFGAATEPASLWLLLRAFSSGCTAMTGVEAVSNGVMAFREPRAQSAKRTLAAIIVMLMLLLAGIALLCRAYHIGATEPGRPGYESVLSQIAGAVAGKGWFYYLTIGSILLVLAFQANTAFADFPRLCRAVAHDGYLPRSFADRGRRLVYTQGIYVLIFLSAALLLFFGGVTDRLIPLFAVGAFLAFTLSQAGMVVHWKRSGGRRAKHYMAVNGLGAVTTAVTVIVVIVSKFIEGAWITLLLIPALLAIMYRIRHHYTQVEREMACVDQLSVSSICQPIVVVPIEGWNRITLRGLRFALTLSTEVTAVHIETEEEDGHLAKEWPTCVEEPARKAGYPPPRLVVLKSPYRYILSPIYNYILELERQNPQRQIAVVVPTLIEQRWYYNLLHNQHGEMLTALLLFKGNRRIVIVNVPWYLKA
jgi:amino acid transporter